ncbi:hypothetical protein [Bradyrhizobium paxllaeri]|uniref:hypothetical protein n=1 Tax=Bradyrhizobium paxllaeri TaxID=190148 RepID=UPI0011463E0F|nr:hypothetical protein [Bradyrhizobium paxllaeri]
MTLPELMEYIKNAGGLAAPIFAVLYWLERDERKDAQRELREIAEQSAVAMSELKSMVAQLVTIFGNQSHPHHWRREWSSRG